jgi:hypothetical protein
MANVPAKGHELKASRKRVSRAAQRIVKKEVDDGDEDLEDEDEDVDEENRKQSRAKRRERFYKVSKEGIAGLEKLVDAETFMESWGDEYDETKDEEWNIGHSATFDDESDELYDEP